MGNFKFIKGNRYLVEVKGTTSGRVMTRIRAATRLKAFRFRDRYDKWVGLTARVFDTKTGKILVVGELE